MTVDLRTRYLGLELRSPIVASAAPLNGEPAMAAPARATPGVGAIVLPSLFEEEIVHEEIELNRALEPGTEHFAEALDYFPAVERRSSAPATATSRSLERIKAAGRRPGHRQPQRHARRRLGPLRAAHRRTPAPTRSSSTCTTSPPIPTRTAADMEAADLDARRRRPRRGRRSRSRSSSARTTRRSPTSPPRSSTPAPTGSCCSTASTSRTSTSTRSRSCRGSS